MSAFEALIEAYQKERYHIADAIRKAALRGNLEEAQRSLNQAWRVERFLSAVQQLKDVRSALEFPVLTLEIRKTIKVQARDFHHFPLSIFEKSLEPVVLGRLFRKEHSRGTRA